jgi:hypothetical protein
MACGKTEEIKSGPFLDVQRRMRAVRNRHLKCYDSRRNQKAETVSAKGPRYERSVA